MEFVKEFWKEQEPAADGALRPDGAPPEEGEAE